MKKRIWMCLECGRWAVHREDVGDESCYLNAKKVRFDKETHVIPKPGAVVQIFGAPLPEGTIRLVVFE